MLTDNAYYTHLNECNDRKMMENSHTQAMGGTGRERTQYGLWNCVCVCVCVCVCACTCVGK